MPEEFWLGRRHAARQMPQCFSDSALTHMHMKNTTEAKVGSTLQPTLWATPETEITGSVLKLVLTVKCLCSRRNPSLAKSLPSLQTAECRAWNPSQKGKEFTFLRISRFPVAGPQKPVHLILLSILPKTSKKYDMTEYSPKQEYRKHPAQGPNRTVTE